MPATDYKDYYKILGVDKTAGESEIKKAFRRLARQSHPDLNPNDKAAEARFKEINEAYEVLSDPDKRKKYDQFGQYWRQMDSGFPGGGPGGGTGGFDVDFGQYGSFDDFINELLGRFGGGFGGPRGNTNSSYTYRTSPSSPGGFGGFQDFAGFGGPAAGTATDAEADITLTLKEALNGTEKRLMLSSGETITVKIPAGAKPGSRIRVRGKGHINPRTQGRGDLYLSVKVQPHPFFKFEGDQLVCEVPITPDEAVLGAKIEVPTGMGVVQVNIPAGVKSGQSLRLRGKGWPQPKGGHGDQLIKIQIVPPKDLTATERDYYEKIAASRKFNPRSHLESL
ncbi:MAG: DnaJ C-terminal domain-containing protein [Thermosynechococcaceae cyanobacterium]